MRIDRFQVELKVIPHLLQHGAQADRLQAMVAGDEVIRARLFELADRATHPLRDKQATA